MERSGLVFGHVNPTTGVVSNLWGNQARIALTPVIGTTISKNLGRVQTMMPFQLM